MNRLPGPSEQQMRNMLLMQQFLQQQHHHQQQQQFIRQQQLQQAHQQRALMPQMQPQHLPFLSTAAMPSLPTVPGPSIGTKPTAATTKLPASSSKESAPKPNAKSKSKSPPPTLGTDLPPGVLRVFQRLVGEAIADYRKALDEGGNETAEAVVIAIYEALLEACAPFGNVKQLLAPRERMMELIRQSLEFKLELQKNEAKGKTKSSDEKGTTTIKATTTNANTNATAKQQQQPQAPASASANGIKLNVNAMRRYREGLATMQLQQQAARQHNNTLAAASAQPTNPWVGGPFSQQQHQQQQHQQQLQMQMQMQIQLLQAQQNQRRELLCWPGLDPISRSRIAQEVLDRQAYLDSLSKSPAAGFVSFGQWNASLSLKAAVHQNLIVPPPSDAKEAQVTALTMPIPKSSTTTNANQSAAETPKAPKETSSVKPKNAKKSTATAEKTTTKRRTTLVKAKRRTALSKTKKKALVKKPATEKTKIANGGGEEGNSQPLSDVTDKNPPVDLEDDDLVRNSFHEPASGFKPINGDDITSTDISEFGDASSENVETAHAPPLPQTAPTEATVQTPAPPPKKWNLDDSKLSEAAKRRLKRLAPFNSPGMVNKGECDFESVLGFTEDAGERPRRRSRVAPEFYQEPTTTTDTKPKAIPPKKIARPKKKSKKTEVVSAAKTKKKTLASTIQNSDNGDSKKKKKLKSKQKIKSSDSTDSTVVATKKKPPEDLMNLLASKKTRTASVVANPSKSPGKSARNDDISETVNATKKRSTSPLKTEQEPEKLPSGKRKLPSNHAELTTSSSLPTKSSSSDDSLATAKAMKKRSKSPLKKKKDGIESASRKRKLPANHVFLREEASVEEKKKEPPLPKAANSTSSASSLAKKKDKKARAVLERKRRKKGKDTSSPPKSSRKPKGKKVSTSLNPSDDDVKTPSAVGKAPPDDGTIPEYLPPSVQKALKRLAPHNVPGNVTAGDNAFILEAALHAPSGTRRRRSRAKDIDYSEL